MSRFQDVRTVLQWDQPTSANFFFLVSKASPRALTVPKRRGCTCNTMGIIAGSACSFLKNPSCATSFSSITCTALSTWRAASYCPACDVWGKASLQASLDSNKAEAGSPVLIRNTHSTSPPHAAREPVTHWTIPCLL
jgi:hypothetical protein